MAGLMHRDGDREGGDQPGCYPEKRARLPCGSMTDWKTICATSLVLLPIGSNVAVCSATWPGTPSNSKVAQIRSGATTSWLTPRNPYSAPSAPLWITRHSPPRRESNLSILISSRRGPHHCANSFGSVYALKTSSRGASRTVVETSSCFPGSITYSVLGIVLTPFSVIFLLLLFDEILQNFVQALEAFVPEAPVLPHPLGGFLQAPDLEAAGSPLGTAPLRDQPSTLQHLQVFRNAGEAQVERLGQLRYRRLALGKTSQDRPPGGIGEGCERAAELIVWHLIFLSC